eukprot:jgi/Tetstr1/423904/TSEL_014527.t1
MQALNWLGAALGGSGKSDIVSEVAAGVVRKMGAAEEVAKPVKRARFAVEEWIASGNEAVTFRLEAGGAGWADAARSAAGGGFRPEYTHQVFSDEEEVKGYKDLSIDIFLNARTFAAYAEVSFSEKAAKADDVDSMLSEAFGGQLLLGAEGKADFEAGLVAAGAAGEPSVADFGTEIGRKALPGGDGGELVLCRFNLASAPEALQGLHARLEPMLLFFIDGACSIDGEDPAWDVVLALRQSGASLQVMGFCTLHTFFAYPDTKRLQLSQLLVLAPFQRRGVASAMMAALMRIAAAEGAKDVTYEDPTPAVECLREVIDLRACLSAGWLLERAEAAVQSVLASGTAAGAELLLLPPPELSSLAQRDLQLSPTWV